MLQLRTLLARIVDIASPQYFQLPPIGGHLTWDYSHSERNVNYSLYKVASLYNAKREANPDFDRGTFPYHNDYPVPYVMGCGIANDSASAWLKLPIYYITQLNCTSGANTASSAVCTTEGIWSCVNEPLGYVFIQFGAFSVPSHAYTSVGAFFAYSSRSTDYVTVANPLAANNRPWIMHSDTTGSRSALAVFGSYSSASSTNFCALNVNGYSVTQVRGYAFAIKSNDGIAVSSQAYGRIGAGWDLSLSNGNEVS